MWDYERSTPGTEGWYAVLLCWDSREGFFAEAWFWNGKVWNKKGPCLALYGPFDTEIIAEKWAEKHNPDN